MIVRPWLYKVELSRGCNLACRFCPIYAIPEYSENKKFLEPDMMLRIAKGIHEMNPMGRVEMTMRGEPTLNPHLKENLRVLRDTSPKLQLSMHTNGVLLLKNEYRITDILDFGVNILNIDCYNNTEDRFHEMACAEIAAGADFELVDHEDDFGAYRRHSNGHKLRVVNLIPDISASDNPIAVRQIHSNAGNGDPKVMAEYGVGPPRDGKCARPFREYVITFDGKVILCCHDWNTEAIIGDLEKQTLSEIWYGNEHRRHLRYLYEGDRHHAPCNKCDYHGGYRLALLKDPR